MTNDHFIIMINLSNSLEILTFLHFRNHCIFSRNSQLISICHSFSGLLWAMHAFLCTETFFPHSINIMWVISSIPKSHLQSLCSWVTHLYPSPEGQRFTDWSTVTGFYKGISNLVVGTFFHFFPLNALFGSLNIFINHTSKIR